MSLPFKSKYEQMRENSQSTEPESDRPDLPDNDSPVRNICFVLEDGSMTFLNYGYLISGSIDAEKQKITLSFTSHEVELEGSRLGKLFYELLLHKTRLIKTTDNRYEALETENVALVGKIVLIRNE